MGKIGISIVTEINDYNIVEHCENKVQYYTITKTDEESNKQIYNSRTEKWKRERQKHIPKWLKK